MLEKALENIEIHFPIVGTTERFDESLILMKNFFNWQNPYYKIANKTKDRLKKHEIDNDTINLIKEFNKEDYILYNQINKRIDKQICLIPDFNKQLFNFVLLNNFLTKVPKKLEPYAYNFVRRF